MSTERRLSHLPVDQYHDARADCEHRPHAQCARKWEENRGGFKLANVGDDGSYDNVSEYIRDLIRRDNERIEAEAFNRLQAKLTHA